MREFAVYITVHEKAICHIEAESEEEAMKKARDMYENRELDYYEEMIGSIEVEEERAVNETSNPLSVRILQETGSSTGNDPEARS